MRQGWNFNHFLKHTASKSLLLVEPARHRLRCGTAERDGHEISGTGGHVFGKISIVVPLHRDHIYIIYFLPLQILGQDLDAFGGRQDKRGSLWLRSRREEGDEEDPAFWLRSRRADGFWLRDLPQMTFV